MARSGAKWDFSEFSEEQLWKFLETQVLVIRLDCAGFKGRDRIAARTADVEEAMKELRLRGIQLGLFEMAPTETANPRRKRRPRA